MHCRTHPRSRRAVSYTPQANPLPRRNAQDTIQVMNDQPTPTPPEATDQWQQILQAARSIDQRYQQLDMERLGRIWSPTEFLAACATDWGELVEGIMKLEGLRPGEGDIEAVRH